MNGKIVVLKKISFFSSLDEDDLSLISGITKEINYEPETTIFKEGDKGNSLFIILDGIVKIYKDTIAENKKVLASLKTMEVFGELAVFDELPRSATAITSTKCKCLVINSEDLDKLMEGNHGLTIKLFKQVIRTLSNRIRKTNEKFENNIIWGFTANL